MLQGFFLWWALQDAEWKKILNFQNKWQKKNQRQQQLAADFSQILFYFTLTVDERLLPWEPGLEQRVFVNHTVPFTGVLSTHPRWAEQVGGNILTMKII